MVLYLLCGNICFAQSEDANLTYHPSQMFDIYAGKGVYASAVYNGNLENATCIDGMNGIYSNNYGYNNGYNGYFMYDRDEVVSVFGKDSNEFKGLDASGAKYFGVNRDFALRHEKDIADADGVKKDAWFTDKYYRYSKNAVITGGMGFGLETNDIIKPTDSELTIVIEYLDNGEGNMVFQYINTDWNRNGYSGNYYEFFRTNTGKWKTSVITVPNAKFYGKSDTGNTGLCSGREDFVIKGNNMYISRVMIVKTADVKFDLSAKHQTVLCPKKTYTDKKGNTYYFMLAPGMRAITPYVTQQNWDKSGIKFVFANDNDEMYEYDTVNETLRFLDYAGTGTDLNAYVTPDNYIYYSYNRWIYRINWDTYQREVVSELPSGSSSLSMQVTNDGRYINGYYYGNSVGGKIVRYDTQQGAFDKAFGKNFSFTNPYSNDMGHPLINPVYPNILFFCNEGDTAYIPDRLWMVDADTGKFTNIFRQSYNESGLTAETSGHEVWNKDGEYLYFVKYTYNQNKGQNGIVRILFEDGKFTGEREYINGDVPYWHCYPSGDNNWVAADTMNGEIYLISTKNHSCDLIAQFEKISSISPNGREYYYDHPYQPHPRMSYNGKSINWQMASDNNPDNLGVAWADVSAYTQNTDYTENIYPSDDGNIISYNNTKSQAYEKQIQGKTFVCADNGNNVYYNIDDNYIKNINIPVRLAFTAYSDSDDEITIGYTSGVKDEYNFHKYQDKKIVLDAKKGINTYTVDMGYINAFNVCDYRSDMYFIAKNGTVCVDDIMVSTYDETFDIYTKDAIYTLSANGDDESYGLYALNVKQPIVDINDKQSILDLGIDEKSYELAKNAGYKYVTSSSDGAWNYKTVTDADGITKNAWFTTKHARFINGEPRQLGGYIYFGVSNNVITKDDSELIVTVEYLDNRTEPFHLLYLTGKNTYGNKKIVPSNSGKWKTVTFALNDAVLSGTNSGTGLGSGKEDMRFEAYSVDLYISKVIIQKADKKIVTTVLADKSKSGATVTNNTLSDSVAKLYTVVFDDVGTLLRIYVSEDTTVGAMNTSELTNNITANKGETIKSFVLENNIKPYVPAYNPLELSVTVTEECAILSWNGFKDKDDIVYYEVYCDGKYIATVTDTTYTADKSYSSYMVKAVDLYGKQLETSYNHNITFK